jgi:FkbH-like protein
LIRGLAALLDFRADRDGDRPAFTFLQNGETPAASLTWAGLRERALAVAARLRREAAPGERALLLYPAGLDFVAAFFGCLYAGVLAVPVPLPRRRGASGERLENVARSTGAGLGLTTAALVSGLERDFAHLSGLRWIADPGEGETPEEGAGGGDGDAVAYLQCTSGSVSEPKGVMVSHANALYNLQYIDAAFRHDGESVAISWLPHFHDMGLIYGVLQPIYNGFPCFLMSPATFIQRPVRWLNALSRFRATHSGAPNFAYDLCAGTVTDEQREELDLGAWRVAFNGAEPVRRETLERFAETFVACGFRRTAFHPAYGLAEATLKVTCPTGPREPEYLEERGASRVGCGPAMMGTRVAIVSPDSLEPCAAGETGEIWVSGPGVARGYWGLPEETESTFRARLAGEPGTAWLRTGDLGLLRDGELFVTGRWKDLIILRGQNHYPQDLERTAAAALGAPVLVAAFSTEEEGGERLVLLIETRADEEGRQRQAWDIRQAVAGGHELPVYAVVFVRPGGIPRTTSGKLRRQAAKAAYLTGGLDAVGTVRFEDDSAPIETGLPADPETLVRELVARVLRTDAAAVDPEVPLVSLGLDSLAAAALARALEAAAGVAVPQAELLGDLTAAQLAASLYAGRPASAPRPISKAEDGETLSFEQERLWLLDRLCPGRSVHNLAVAIDLAGTLDRPRLEAALRGLVARHPALRTAIPESAGRPRPRLLPKEEVSRLSVVRVAGDLEARLRDETAAPFSVDRGPLARFTLFETGPDRHLLLAAIHHVVSDAWSLRVLVRDLAALYRGDALPVLPVTTFDLARVERESWSAGEHDADLDAWRRLFAGGVPEMRLPPERDEPATSTFQFAIPETLEEAVRAFAGPRRLTPFMVLAAAFTAALARATGSTDLVFAAPTAGRSGPETAGLIGLFAYPVPLRIDAGGDPSFAELAGRVRSRALEAYAHAVPFLKLAEAVRGISARVMLGFVEHPVEPRQKAGLQWSPAAVERSESDVDLFLTVRVEDGRWRGELEYRTSLFGPDTAAAFAGAFRAALEQGAADPSVRLSGLGLPDCDLAGPGLRIAVAATFTAEPLAASLRFWLDRLRVPGEIVFAPFNQVLQQLLEPGSVFDGAQANVLLVRALDWPAPADRQARDLVSALAAARRRNPVPFLLLFLPGPDSDRELERLVREGLAGESGVHVVSAEDIDALYPVTRREDPHADRLGAVPYAPEYFIALGTAIARRLACLRREPFKVIAVDADQTLWRGVCGEDGPTGVEVDPPRAALQRFLLEQREAGMLLCLCSKNQPEDVAAVFERNPGMLLRPEHFAAQRVNWLPKSENLSALAAELSLSPSSFVFLDDDALECAEVRARLPEALALRLPEDASRLPAWLRHVWAFDRLSVTAEDRRRAAFYEEDRERERLLEVSGGLREFLEGLDLRVEIAPMRPDQVARVAQLTQRTNQFHTTLIRRGEAEVGVPSLEVLTINVHDRFGSYGLVGAMIVRAAGGELVLEQMLLSCRALGRGVEHRMMRHLGGLAAERGLGSVSVPAVRGPRNEPVLSFLERLPGEKTETGEGWTYRFAADRLRALTLEEVLAETGPRTAAEAPRQTVLVRPPYERIASELATVASIQEAMRGGSAPTAAGSGAKTRTEEELAAICAELLELESVDVDRDFTEMGGHSIVAVQLVSRVLERFGVELPLQVFFAGDATVRSLAAVIEARLAESAGASEVEQLLRQIEQLSDEEARALLSGDPS